MTSERKGRTPGQPTDTTDISESEYKRILMSLVEHWRLFFELLWESGVRVGEALAIKKSDLENNGVWITREKRRDHPRDFIGLSSGLFIRLKIYASHFKGIMLFPYTASAAWLALKKAAKAAGIKRNIHPHSFRHAFGYRAINLKLGDDVSAANQLGIVQRMMGHTRQTSTLVYTKPRQEDVDEAFKRMNQER